MDDPGSNGLWPLVQTLAAATEPARVTLHLKSGRDLTGHIRAAHDDVKIILLHMDAPQPIVTHVLLSSLEAISVSSENGASVAVKPQAVPLRSERSVTLMQRELRQKLNPGIFCELDYGGRALGDEERQMVQRLVEDCTAVLTAMAEDEALRAVLQDVRIIRMKPGASASLARERDVLTLTTAERARDALTRGELRRKIEELL